MEVGDRVRISRDNDNDNYDKFRGLVLYVIKAEIGGIGYDECMYPEKLMSFVVEGTVEDVPFSLYEYEVEEVDEYEEYEE